MMKIEDETGSTELRLFGNNVFNFGRFGIPMTPVLVTCKWQRRFRDSELSFEIVNIRPLTEVKGRLVDGITVNLSTEQVKPEMLQLLSEHIESSREGRGWLKINIFDPKINRNLMLRSAKKVPLNRKLINMLDDMNINFSVHAVDQRDIS